MSSAHENRPTRVLLTGADGFVGKHLRQLLEERRIAHRAAVRSLSTPDDSQRVAVGDIGPSTDWRAVLDGVDVVVHLAARAHILKETSRDPRAQFMRVNADGTARLVESAAVAGVRRFIYLSSVGVLGNASGIRPFTADTPPQPHNAYTESKLAGEIAAQSAASRLEVVVVRVPLVYGTGVRANFHRLLQMVDRGWPLPLAAVANRRSFLNVWNLCALVDNVLTNPVAKNRTWLVSDGEDVSTPDLIERIATALRRRVRLFTVPVSLLYGLGRLAGREAQIAQLCGSLTVDITQTCNELGWQPPVSVDEGLQRTVRWYISAARG